MPLQVRKENNMATPPLTDDQKKINSILKEKGYYTFSVKEYDTDIHATKLLEKFARRKIDSFGDTNFNIYIYRKLSHKKIPTSVITLDTETERDATKILFGLSNNSLIETIMDYAYADAIDQDQDGNYSFGDGFDSKISTWIEYSNTIDRCYQQYRADQEKWRQNRKSYKEYWKQLSKEPLFATRSDSIIHEYCSFLDKRHGLKQKSKVKGEFLINLQFPNVKDMSIAQQIVETSSLLR